MTAVPESLRETLSHRYAIEREIGRGGMATVYLARDTADGRTVAVKVMHEALVATVGADRFLREMELAATLVHPHIVPLIDSGTAGRLLYYVMPYVEGETLYQRLERERRLPLDEAFSIAGDIASALSYAHGRGVLHRDIKPENVVLAAGGAMVLDFGLARAIGTADYRRLTQTGIIVGTVFYMSPEQIREDRNLDQRTDIYALGCILYEMLTGAPPFVGRSLSDIISKILKGSFPSVRTVRPEVPTAVEDVVGRALAKGVDQRFATAADFAAAVAAARR
jgi:serine/threonine-protein kinase